MANTAKILKMPEYDSLMQGVIDNFDSFVENISCIRDTFEYSEVNLRAQHSKTFANYNDFLSTCDKEERGEKTILKVPEGRIREFLTLKRRKARSQRAIELIPPSYLVSLVSAFDTFFAGLVRCFYDIFPEKLLESELPFLYRDLQTFTDLRDIKNIIIDKNVETLLRDSHEEQFNWFSKALGVSTLKSFDGWSDFIELTERRNLFVHSNGTVSEQYITICKKHSALQKDIIAGNQLSVDKSYFEKAYKILYKTAIMLTQMLLRVKYLEKAGKEKSSDVDKSFINTVFDLIVEELYDVAIDVSKMVVGNKNFTHNAFDRSYILLNYAQAYKWSGDDNKCKEVLDLEDWTAHAPELLIPLNALRENYPEVYQLMRQLGKENTHITISAYREWPIFKMLRAEKEFETVFTEVFGEELGRITEIEIDNPVERKDATVTINQKTEDQ